MPVLVNNSTGLAENLPDQAVPQAVSQDTHSVLLNDPQGNQVTVPYGDAASYVQEGYSEPSPEQFGKALQYAHYSSTPERAKAFLEGAASVPSFGLSTLAETKSGLATPEDIRGRREANPGTYLAGQAVGILAPGGAMESLSGAGKAAAEMSGLGRIGQAAVKQAVEGALLQGSDEVSKRFSSDPEQTVQTALVNMGLSGLIGGAIGGGLTAATAPLWNAAQGSKIGQMLQIMREKAQGTATSLEAQNLADQAGITLAPEMKAALSGAPMAEEAAQSLREAGTKAGSAFRDSELELKKQASDAIVNGLGRDIDAAKELSDHDAGRTVQKAIQDELAAKTATINAQYEPIKAKYASMELPPNAIQDVGEQLHQLAQKEGYALSESSPAMKEINRITTDLPNVKTLEDLRKYQGVVRDNIMSANVSPRLASQVGGILREAEESALANRVGAEAPELLAQHQAARQAYKGLMGTVDALNERLHVGKYYGPDSFIKAVGEMAPEDVLRRAKGVNDAGMLDILKQFPQAAQAVKDYHVDSLLRRGATSPGAVVDGGFNTRAFFSALEKMSPEMRDFAVGGAQPQLQAAQDLLKRIPARINPSGTARAIDTLWKHMPGGISAMISGLLGHNPVLGWAVGSMGRWVGREAPDAMKLAMLKAVGSEAEASPMAFKNMFHLADAAYKGANTVNRALKNVFRQESEVLTNSELPKAADRGKIEGYIKAAQIDPMKAANSTQLLAHYLPDHATEAGAAIGRVTNYLNSLRPNTDKPAPLDAPRKVNSFETAQYERAISLAEQPLMILKHLKEGTILPQDVQAVSNMYPALYSSLKNGLMEHIVDHTDMPYKLKVGLGLFMGQPLDSSTMPQNLLANHGQGVGLAQPPPMQPRGSQGTLKGFQAKGLAKLPSLAATPQQSRLMSKAPSIS